MTLAAAIKTMLAADVTATRADEDSSLVWSGVTVAGTFSPIDNGGETDADQFTRVQDGEFVAVKSLFTAGVPPRNAVVSINATNYFVVSSVDDEAAVTLRVRRVEDKTSTQGIV